MSDEPQEHRRKLFEYDPKISSGTLLSIAIAIVMAAGGLMAYSADQAKRDMRVTQLEKDSEVFRKEVEKARHELSETLKEIKGELKTQTVSIGEVNTALAVMKATAQGSKK